MPVASEPTHDARGLGACRARAHAVLVGQFTVQHIADDLHVAVAVGAKTLAGCHGVVVEHQQVAMALVVDVELAAE